MIRDGGFCMLRSVRFSFLGLLMASTPWNGFAGEAANGFRGPTGNGVWPGEAASIPAEASKALWRHKPEGFGWAAPVSGGGKVFLLAANSAKIPKPANFSGGVADMRSFLGGAKPPKAPHTWTLTALDTSNGKSLWTTQLFVGAPQIAHHPSNTYATETPVTLGKRVVCWVGSCGQLVCLDTESGNILWKKDLGVQARATGFGTGSSPAADGERVFVQCDNEKDSFVAAFSLNTGAELWRQKRQVKTSWSTPLVWKNAQRTELVLCGDSLVASYDPATGKELWRYTAIRGGFATSPSADQNLLLACKSDPTNSGQFVAIRAGHNGDLTPTKGAESGPAIAWAKSGGGPGLGSPVLAKGRLFVANNNNLTCLDASTGQQIWKERLPGAKSVAASAWALGDSVFVLDESGKLFRVANEATFRLLGKSDFGDLHWSTPDLGTGKLLLRGVDELLCLPLQ